MTKTKATKTKIQTHKKKRDMSREKEQRKQGGEGEGGICVQRSGKIHMHIQWNYEHGAMREHHISFSSPTMIFRSPPLPDTRNSEYFYLLNSAVKTWANTYIGANWPRRSRRGPKMACCYFASRREWRISWVLLPLHKHWDTNTHAHAWAHAHAWKNNMGLKP